MLPGAPREGDFVDVAFVAEVPASGALFVTAGNREVMLARHQGEIVAYSGNCTHNFARLAEGWVADGVVTCPRHGGKFEVATGRALSSICRNLPSLPVRVQGRRVQVNPKG